MRDIQSKINNHTLKPKDILSTLREEKNNNFCFNCKSKNPTFCDIKKGILICSKCKNEESKSILFDRINKEELLRLILGNNEGMEIESINKKIIEMNENIENKNKINKNIESEKSSSKLKNKISIESLKKKRAERKKEDSEKIQIEETIKKDKIEIQNKNLKEESIQYESIKSISLDKPRKFTFQGSGDVGLITDKKEESENDSFNTYHHFIKKEKKVTLTEKGKNIVEGIVNKFKRQE